MYKEHWKTIPSLPMYEASSHGRIRHKIFYGLMPNGAVRKYGGKAWLGCWDGKRYIFVYHKKNFKVARIICEAFHGPAPENKPYCARVCRAKMAGFSVKP